MAKLKSTTVAGSLTVSGTITGNSLDIKSTAIVRNNLTVTGSLIGGAHMHNASDVVLYSTTTPTVQNGVLWLKPL